MTRQVHLYEDVLPSTECCICDCYDLSRTLIQCKKEAVTDAVKRTLRNFGNLLGNCLYDKAYTQEVIKIKVPPVCGLAREVTSSILTRTYA